MCGMHFISKVKITRVFCYPSKQHSDKIKVKALQLKHMDSILESELFSFEANRAHISMHTVSD